MENQAKSAFVPTAEDFADLYGNYYGKVHRVIHRLVNDPLDAEELTQETFLKVQRYLPALRHPERLSSWIYRIASNTALDFLRRSTRAGRRGSSQVSLDEYKAIAPDSHSPESSLNSSESVDCVRTYADQLPEQYRLVLILHDLESLPLAEVAQIMGSSVGATKVRLHRARKRFAEICAAECEQFIDDEGTLCCQPSMALPLTSADSTCCDMDAELCSCS